MTFRQYNLLDSIIHEHRNHVNLDTVLTFNQNIFGSLCARKWVSYDIDRECFFVNEDGKVMVKILSTWLPYRENHDDPLGLRVQKVMGQLQTVRRRA